MTSMNEQTMIWFLQKTSKYALSKEAEGLWMDFYSYLQNQSRACNPQIPFSVLQQVCDLKEEELQMACQELKDADMLRFVFDGETILCRLTAGKLYRSSVMAAEAVPAG